LILKKLYLTLLRISQTPKTVPAKKLTSIRRMNAGIVKVIIRIELVYYKYDNGLRYPARGATGIVMLVPHTLLT
jgi:hypothetical protein